MVESRDNSADALERQERCPRCSSLLEHADSEFLEEYCIEPGCDYYRAEGASGEVIRQ